jgi:hypothetical protein
MAGSLCPRNRFRRVSGGGDHQAEQLPLGITGARGGRLAGGQQHRQGLPVPVRPGRAQIVPRQGFPGCADGVEGAGLGAVAPLGALGPVQLDDGLVPLGQDRGQAVAVPAGALDRPGPQPAVLAGEVDQFLAAVGVGGHGDLGEDPAGACINHRGAAGMHVGVDPDDDLGDLLQTGHAFISFARRGT